MAGAGRAAVFSARGSRAFLSCLAMGRWGEREGEEGREREAPVALYHRNTGESLPRPRLWIP